MNFYLTSYHLSNGEEEVKVSKNTEELMILRKKLSIKGIVNYQEYFVTIGKSVPTIERISA